MPQIKEYRQQTDAGGTIESRRAQTGDAFALGPELGAVISGAGDIVMAADIRERRSFAQQQQQADVTNVYSQHQKILADAEVEFAQLKRTAPAGDVSFIAPFQERIGQMLQDVEGLAQTPAGRDAAKKQSATLAAHFVRETGLYQVEAAGKQAVAEYRVMEDNAQRTISTNPMLFPFVLEQTERAINDPNGSYAARLSGAEREALLKGTREKLGFTAVQAIIQNDAPEFAKKLLMDLSGPAEFIDPDKKQQLLREAEVGINAKDQAKERARIDADRVRKELQDASMSSALARIVDPKANGGVLSDREILADTTLDAAHKQHLIDYKLRRARELQAQSQERANPGEVRRLLLDIHAADDDPRKTYNNDAVMASYKTGRITTPEMMLLNREVLQLKDGSSNSFQQDVHSVRGLVERRIGQSPEFIMQPELVISGVRRFNMELDRKVQEYRSLNKDPRLLLDDTNKDSPLYPHTLRTFFRPARAAVAAEATRMLGANPGATGTWGDNPRYPEAVNPKTGEKMIFKDGKWQKP